MPLPPWIEEFGTCLSYDKAIAREIPLLAMRVQLELIHRQFLKCGAPLLRDQTAGRFRFEAIPVRRYPGSKILTFLKIVSISNQLLERQVFPADSVEPHSHGSAGVRRLCSAPGKQPRRAITSASGLGHLADPNDGFRAASASSGGTEDSVVLLHSGPAC
jgi:hypothetical protein